MKKILVIDDQKDNITTISAVIKSNIQDCKILQAMSGKEGIKIARKEQPDTILLDIIMPKMSGFEATKQIKEFNPILPIIAQTAYAIVGDREKAMDAGCDDYLSKPINRDKLMKIIKQYIE